MVEERRRDFDYLLENYIGGSGYWQWRVFWIMRVFMGLVMGFPLFLHLFTAYTPDHRCYVPQCDSDNSSVLEAWVNFSVPHEHSTSNFLKEDGDFDPCNRYLPESESPLGSLQEDTCSPEVFSNKTAKCDKYIYDLSLYEETLTTKLDLVCDNEWKRKLIGTFLMSGLLVGSLLGGPISDRFGRKKALLGAMLVQFPFFISEGFSTSYEMFVGFRFITACTLPIMWVTASTYTLELFSPKKRKTQIVLGDIPILQFVQIAVVYYLRHWTQIYVCGAILALALAIPGWFFLPESPRWLVNNNKKEEALKMLLNMAKVNKKNLTEMQEKEVAKILDELELQSHNEQKLNGLHMLHKDHLYKTLIMLFNWAMACLSYYALSLNATKLSGNLYVNYLLFTIADSPVGLILFLLLDRIGRRYTMMMVQILLGTTCVVLALIPKSATTWVLIVFLFGKWCAGASFTMVYTYTAELYPTNLRTQAVGNCSMVSRIFGLVAPFISQLAIYWKSLPMLLLGVPAIFAGILSLKLPETSGKDLPQTLEEAKALGDSNKIKKKDIKE